MKKRREHLPKFLWSGLLGLAVALAWHFIHSAGEPDYTSSLSDPHFWLHLLTEGAIALYTAGVLLVIAIVVERMRSRK